MPKYTVLKPGFYDGALYDPKGKRNTLTTDKPLKKIPTWLKLQEKEAVEPISVTKMKKPELVEFAEKLGLETGEKTVKELQHAIKQHQSAPKGEQVEKKKSISDVKFD